MFNMKNAPAQNSRNTDAIPRSVFIQKGEL